MDIDVEVSTTEGFHINVISLLISLSFLLLVAWITIIDNAKHELDIAQFYWTLTDGEGLDDSYGARDGLSIFNKIIEAHNRGVRVRIVQVELTS
jgi:hypothetical protein